ncbi:MAG: selenocysteine-specific translation elongation factor [Gammaproteobacteria bacterium]|nr:selenocysteine-specific translation elongation factor [Gammaproteobacteria bacterium]
MIVTLAGHVDHGKTALVKAITGVDTDRLEEEKRRGLTIDLGFAYHDLNGNRVGFVDVPGHHRFIHNMIAGVANMQHGLLVVAANDGVMPQTIEHLNILKLLGLKNGTIALSKIDVVDRSQVSRVSEQIRQLTRETFLANCPIIETSTMTGHGIVHLQDRLAEAAGQLKRLERERSVRIAIDRSFSPRGVGAVITGTIFDGTVHTGDELRISRSGRLVRLRNIVTNGTSSDFAQAGDRCGIQLSGEPATNISRGDWLRAPANTDQSKFFTLSLSVLEDFPREVRSWSPVHIYLATSHSLGRLLPLADQLVPGENGLADVVSDNSLDVVVGDRLVIRDQDLECTLGGGCVVDVGRPNMRRRHLQRVRSLNELGPFVEQDDPIHALLCESKLTSVRLEDFVKKWNIPKPTALNLEEQDTLRNFNGRLLAQERLGEVTGQIVMALKEHHRISPDQTGARLSYIADYCKIDQETVQFSLTCGIEDKVFRLQSGRYSLPSHAVDKPTFNEKLYEQILPFINATQPATTGDIAKSLKIPLRQIETEMKRMSRAKLFVQVTPKRYFTYENIVKLAELATQLAQKQSFSVRDFRDASGIGRMPVIDVLEYFDRLRFTRRLADVRTVIGSLELVQKKEDNP